MSENITKCCFYRRKNVWKNWPEQITDNFDKPAEQFDRRSKCFSSKSDNTFKNISQKITFSSKYSPKNVECGYGRPAKDLLPVVGIFFAERPKKIENILIFRSYVSSHNGTLDT